MVHIKYLARDSRYWKLDMAITSKEKRICFLNVLKSTKLSNVWNYTNILFNRFCSQFLVWLAIRKIKMNNFVIPSVVMYEKEAKDDIDIFSDYMYIRSILLNNNNNITHLYLANKNKSKWSDVNDDCKILDIEEFINFCGAELLLFDINKFDTRSDFSRNYIEFDMRDFDTDKEYLKLEYLSLANSMNNESDLHM